MPTNANVLEAGTTKLRDWRIWTVGRAGYAKDGRVRSY
ncbi:hypothetical protein MTR67_015873 [Solanum verrucosum]|uniref:Uncharacterized protein n=1 Tax=Solanum verrucosum TaxID=315347 RepID=A0AAF0QH94_SOLVR|nr:hypothetical protein MTR67_015873 [Solanum verrucosum]